MSFKKRILIVDDEADHCALVQKLLEKHGFDVEVAYDGVECLKKVRLDPPDAIVLDVVMPEKDGHTVCREIKTDNALCHIPIMILTAESSHVTSTRYSRYRGRHTYADDYLPKPASAETIAHGLKNLLKIAP